MKNRSSFIKTCVVIMAASGLSVGCGGIPKNEILKDAREAYAQARDNPSTKNVEALYDAEQALNNAENAEDADEMKHLAYLAEKHAQRAITVAERKEAEKLRASLVKQQERLLLEAREREIAAKAQEVEMAHKQLAVKQTQIDEKVQEVEIAQKQLAVKQTQIQQLQDELAELKGRETERGLVVTLGDVLFETGKADLLPSAMRNIETLATFLQKHPNRNVLIEGHTDNRGSEEYNQNLSEERANSVRFALIQRGVPSNMILAEGLGESQPIASNASKTGRQQNRRVEITILHE